VRARVLVPLYAALAGLVTWPLVAHLPSSLPRGTEPVSTVPLFNLWTLRWNQIEAGHLYRHYWDAPLFHPTRGAFAFSEPQPLTGLVFTPLAALGRNPVLAYNLVLLAALVLAGVAGHRLARTLGAAPVPAAVTGALALALPFVAAQMGVLQLVMVFPLFLLIDAVVRWADAGGRGTAAQMGLWLAVTFLTCGYYGLFAAVVVGPAALTLVRRDWFTRRRALDLAVAVGVFAVLALPIVLGQASITSDYKRNEDIIFGLSAGSSDFWTLPHQAAGAGLLPWVGSTPEGQALYSGTVLYLLAVAGIVITSVRTTADPSDVQLRRRAVFLLAGVILGRLLSVGLKLDVGGFQPYNLLRDFVPGFASLRSPFRAEVFTQVFLVALASYALDAGWRWLTAPDRARWGRPAAPALGVLAVALAVAETGVMPVPLHHVDRTTPDWVAYLDDHPPPGGPDDNVLAFLPFPRTNGVASYQATVDDMLGVLDSGGTTVNGYSGLFPETYDELEEVARSYPNEDTNELFRRYGVTTVVADRDWLGDDELTAAFLDEDYREAFTGSDAVVYVRR
jgi:hypothetical protein